MEMEFLNNIRYHLYVSPEEWSNWYRQVGFMFRHLTARTWHHQMPRRSDVEGGRKRRLEASANGDYDDDDDESRKKSKKPFILVQTYVGQNNT